MEEKIVPRERLLAIKQVLPEVLAVLESVSLYSKGGSRIKDNEFQTIVYNATIDAERSLIERFYREVENIEK